MRRQLNTLYVTTDCAWLLKAGANIVMESKANCGPGCRCTCWKAWCVLGVCLVSPGPAWLLRRTRHHDHLPHT